MKNLRMDVLNDGTPPHWTKVVIENYAKPWWFRRIRNFSAPLPFGSAVLDPVALSVASLPRVG